MRYRNSVHTQTISGLRRKFDVKLNMYVEAGTNVSATVPDLESLMWDDPTGGNKKTKSCTHLSYVVDDMTGLFQAYHTGDLSNAPSPRFRFDGNIDTYAQLGLYRPSSVLLNAGSYIPVSNVTTDDLGNCVFNAYNQFVNGVRSLDASVSIAESGETPRLFELWQRRKAAPSNLVNGFLGYSFGWKPLISDLRAICSELRRFPLTVRRRLKAIGEGHVVRHFKFNLSSTVNNVNHVTSSGSEGPYPWCSWLRDEKSVNKSRVVCVTIRAKVKPKLTGDAQDLLNKLGALGLVPSLATVWSITRLSFVVDWAFNIGGAIENLQGSLTHDISDVTVCVSDARTREIVVRREDVGGANARLIGTVRQRYYDRRETTVPLLPVFRLPSRPMQYVLLGLLALTNTKGGKLILRGLDGLPLSKKITSKINVALDKLSPRTRRDMFKAYTTTIPGFPGRG